MIRSIRGFFDGAGKKNRRKSNEEFQEGNENGRHLLHGSGDDGRAGRLRRESRKQCILGAKNAAKIGFTAALTGGAAAYGKSEEEGVRLAVEEINGKGGFPIDLMVDDTKAVPAEAMNATKKQIQDKASILIGPMTSNEAKAAGPIIQNAKVPSLEISVTAENITDMGDCIFRNSVPESKNIPQTVKKTHKLLGYQKAAIMYAHDNEQHVTAQKYFKRPWKKKG